MAETSYLWDKPGTGDSPGGGYGNALLNRVIFRMLTNGTGSQGVLQGRLNELEVTDGGGLFADVDTGAAICYGVWFESDAVESIALIPNSAQTIIVRASWATQTARLATTAAALVQTPGVTYEIPLATLTTDGAGITAGPTDARDYCEYTTVLWPFGVSSIDIQADAVTPAKVVDQTRWLDRSVGALQADSAAPATWIHYNIDLPYREVWQCADGATNGVWATFRVPVDFTGASVTLRLRLSESGWAMVARNTRWCYSAWVAASGAVLVNSSACVDVAMRTTYPVGDPWGWNDDYAIGTLAVTAGDLVHVEIYREGGHANDTSLLPAYIHLLRLLYTGDS